VSTDKYGGSILINGVPIAKSDQDVDRMIDSGMLVRRAEWILSEEFARKILEDYQHFVYEPVMTHQRARANRDAHYPVELARHPFDLVLGALEGMIRGAGGTVDPS
jgi:hypothetical protein